MEVKISSCFNDHGNFECGVPQGSVSGPLVFNRLFFDLLFDYIEIDLANYAVDRYQADYDPENEEIVIFLEKNIDKNFCIGSQI